MAPKLTMAEVAKHKTDKDCWIVIKGIVYDVTKFLPDHRKFSFFNENWANKMLVYIAGGKKAILMYAGKDATQEFEMLVRPV